MLSKQKDHAMKTIIQAYSLAQNKVGELIGEPIITDHEDGVHALLALDIALDSHPRVKGEGYYFQIELPDGRRVPFDTAYAEIFGEPPVRQDNRENLYPHLVAAAKALRKKKG